MELEPMVFLAPTANQAIRFGSFSGPWCMEAQDGHAAVPPSKWGESSDIWYWADGEPAYGDWTRPRPSIHMPRWASRITLEITDVRIERLNDISEADAKAEGCVTEEITTAYDGSKIQVPKEIPHPSGNGWEGWDTAKDWYADIWESINGPGAWDKNPWVWCISFKVVL